VIKKSQVTLHATSHLHASAMLHLSSTYRIVHIFCVFSCYNLFAYYCHRYLHSHEPPIVHRDLSSNNILLTTFLRAKIGDLGVAKVIRPDHKKSLTKIPGTIDFMPPEAMTDATLLEYGTALDIFSFGAVILHVATQEWPTPLAIKIYDKEKRRPTALTEVERRQPYLDKITGVNGDLKPLIISCLDDDPSVRPSIISVSERIKDLKKEHSSNNLTTLLDQTTQQVWYCQS